MVSHIPRPLLCVTHLSFIFDDIGELIASAGDGTLILCDATFEKLTTPCRRYDHHMVPQYLATSLYLWE